LTTTTCFGCGTATPGRPVGQRPPQQQVAGNNKPWGRCGFGNADGRRRLAGETAADSDVGPPAGVGKSVPTCSALHTTTPGDSLSIRRQRAGARMVGSPGNVTSCHDASAHLACTCAHQPARSFARMGSVEEATRVDADGTGRGRPGMYHVAFPGSRPAGRFRGRPATGHVGALRCAASGYRIR
jgi:hypothetical protein